LQLAAKVVLSQWDKHKCSLPRFALEAMLSAAAWKPPELPTVLLAGSTSTLLLASGAGVVIALGVYAGFSVWRGYKEKASSPYQFLSQIQRAGASVAPRPVSVG
jgi:hypothetical protein